MTMYPVTALPQQLQRHIEVDPATDCWRWTASLVHGYGRVGYSDLVAKRSRQRRVHRIVWQLLVGDIPGGLDVGHLCHDMDVKHGQPCAGGEACLHRRCCNPDHLGLMTREANRQSIARAKGQTPPHLRTHCPKGHPLDEGNLVVSTRGDRGCRICRREAHRVQRARRQEERRVEREAIRPTVCEQGHDQASHGEWVSLGGRGGGSFGWKCGWCRRLDAYHAASRELARYQEGNHR